MENKKKYIVYGVIGLFSLVLVGYMAMVVVPRVFVTLTKAAPATVVSLADSYLLADKIIATADGKDEAKVNVYIMDKSGKGVANKSVSISGISAVNPEVGVTNNEGKVSFKMTSAVEGQFKLTASVEGTELNKGITVTFRN